MARIHPIEIDYYRFEPQIGEVVMYGNIWDKQNRCPVVWKMHVSRSALRNMIEHIAAFEEDVTQDKMF